MTDLTGVQTRPPDPFPDVDHPATRPRGPYQHAFWFALLLATAILLGGTAVTAGAYTADAQPQTVVLAYFAALQRGDAATALGYGARPEGSGALLTASVLAAQNAAGAIQNVTVDRVRRTGDRAEVDVTYTVGYAVDPVVVDDTVPVVRAGHGWRLVTSAVPQQIAQGGGSDLARMVGFALPEGDFPMFPGAVPVTYVTPTLALAPGSRVVSFNEAGLLLVDAAVSRTGRATLTAAVVTTLRSCLSGRSATQYLCPTPNSAVAVPGSLRGRLTGSIDEALVFRLPGVDGEISVSGNVSVAASYQRLDVNDIVSKDTTEVVPVDAHAYATKPEAVWWVDE